MMTDKELRFSENQALADGATSEKILRVGKGDAGIGNTMSLYVHVAGASGDLSATLETGDMEDMSDAGEVATFHAGSAAVANGGKVIDARLPAGCKTYLRLAYAGAAGGTVSAGLAKDC